MVSGREGKGIRNWNYEGHGIGEMGSRRGLHHPLRVEHEAHEGQEQSSVYSGYVVYQQFCCIEYVA